MDIIPADEIVVSSLEAMIELAVAGLGVATPPRHRVSQLLQSNDLLEALPGWQLPPIPVHAVWSSDKVEHPIRRQFLDRLIASTAVFTPTDLPEL